MITQKQLQEAEILRKYYDDIITQYYIEESNRNEKRKEKIDNQYDMENYSNDRAFMTGERQLSVRMDCAVIRG